MVKSYCGYIFLLSIVLLSKKIIDCNFSGLLERDTFFGNSGLSWKFCKNFKTKQKTEKRMRVPN